MKSRTFRLEETSIEQLKRIAEARGCTQADAIRFAIQKGHDAIQGAIREQCADGAAEPTLAALAGQLAAKDGQIEALLDQNAQVTAALLSAQESAKAAQALHAADRRALGSGIRDGGEPSRWRRLKSAWRG